MQKLHTKSIIAIALLIVFVSFAYWLVLFGFFQQDEWLAFSRHFVLQNKNIVVLLKNAFLTPGGHYNPFNFLAIHFLFRLFQLNYLPYSIISLFLHLLTVILIFFVSNKLFNDKFLAFLSALLFGTFVAGYQAVSWVVADISTHGATLAILVSMLLVLKYIETEKRRYFFQSVAFLLISLLFKEITIGFFLLNPLLILLYSKFRNFKYSIKVMICIGAVYLIIRFLFTFAPTVYQSNSSVLPQQSITTSLINILTLPPKAIAQTLIPFDVLKTLANKITTLLSSSITGEQGTDAFSTFSETKVLLVLSLFITIVFLSFLITSFFSKKIQSGLNKDQRLVIFGILFIIINSLIFVFSPEKPGIITAIDSRNLYLVSFATAFLIVFLSKRIKKVLPFGDLIFVTCILLVNIKYLNSQLSLITQTGQTRQKILAQIKREHPSLNSKTIFFTSSDRSFYGLSEADRILPFQSGVGQTLLTWYYPKEHFSDEFLNNRFLWEIKDQGYKEVGAQGFGYFRDFEFMVKTLTEQEIDPKNVISYRFNSTDNSLRDISTEVWGRIDGFMAQKKLVNKSSFKIFSDQRSQDLEKLTDGQENTFWDSKLTYDFPQYLQFNFNSNLKIAGIVIDSHTDKNQDKVGYQVLTSTDGFNWKEVFYEKLFPPDSQGKVGIYFDPSNIRFFKLIQIGSHHYASWVINEIKLYEAY